MRSAVQQNNPIQSCSVLSLSLFVFVHLPGCLAVSVSTSLSLSLAVSMSLLCVYANLRIYLSLHTCMHSVYACTYVSFLIVGDMYVRGVCVCTYVCMYVCLHVLINSFQSMFANADIAKYDGNLLSLRGTQGAAHAAQTQCELEPKQLVPAFPGRRGKVPALHLCSCRLVSMASPPQVSLCLFQ